MRRFIFISLMLTWASSNMLQAQDTPKYTIVRRDTINIRGIVYDSHGKPAPSVSITSKNKNLKTPAYPLSTLTDSKGRFLLNEALVKDTLTIEFIGGSIKMINNSSRYLEINLPPIINKEKSFGQITAKRKYKKKPTPTFKVIPNYDCEFGYGLVKNAGFPGGQKKFTRLIKEKIIYPEKAIVNNVEGDVQIGFTINEDGSLKKFTVLKGIGYGCEEQVINAIKKSPNWNPGILNSRAVATQSSITINFKLTDK